MKKLLQTRRWPRGIVCALMLGAGVSSPAATRLTVDEARRLALEHNRTYLAAKEDVSKAEADVGKARAGALPRLDLNGRYNRTFYIPSFFVATGDSAMELRTGFKNSFGATLSLRQSIWKGGRVFTAMKLAGAYRDQSVEAANQVRADVELQAELLFYVSVLQKARLAVLEKSFEAASYSLEVVEKHHSQGLVSEYELLRARVEKSGLQPQLLQGQSEVRLSEKKLKSFLGIDLGEEIDLIDSPTDTSLQSLPRLEQLTDMALAERPEQRRADLMAEIRQKAIRVARADYYPSIEAVSQYDWQAQSDAFTLDENISRSFTAGVTVSLPIFAGGQTRGTVSQATADYNQARLVALQLRDDIRLEVEEAYDRLIQAKKMLDIQGETIAQADEGLRIANLRYESGVGTQLEVLSAQTALTEARRVLAEAMYSFREAKARLKRATTIDIEVTGSNR
ncbi:MAG: TolC family protein [Candidatus Zixiibacteriota bacterium]|nr:MAG: TolC family protein [candidate division Zixibacteria bacterium]